LSWSAASRLIARKPLAASATSVPENTRTIHEPTRRVVFERSEVDGRRHSPWVLESVLTEQGPGETELTMTLTYGGNLWTGAVLERVLDDHVDRGARALRVLVEPAPHKDL
jgi:hypothetical protein